jgi:lysophospholipase L1-like esterase
LAADTTTGGSVVVEFGSATDAVSGSNVSYNVYYAPTAGWSDSDWSVNDVILDVVPAAGTTCANAYTVGGLVSGTEYTFGVRVADASGNEDTNPATLTATPTGDVPESFTDDFSTDPTAPASGYSVVDTWTGGGTGAFLYDAGGQRLRVNTGDNVGMAFSHALAPLNTGIFSIDFSPLVKYPSGGLINIWLRASDGSYYQVSSSDGYGAGGLSKYVGGLQVDTAAFSSGYSQGVDYTITIYFSPTATTVEAFGQVLVMDTDTTVLTVSRMEVELYQQDAYLDNIALAEPDTDPPVWDDPAEIGICSAVDTAAGGSVVVEFGSATDDVSGSNVSYNIYYAPTTGWNGSDWSANNVILDVAPAAGTGCDNAYTVSGLTSGTGYTFGVRVADESGNEDTNAFTATATPTGEAPSSFNDDFSTAPTTGTGPDDYAVVNTETYGGVGAFIYDGAGQRLRVNTGNDVALAFSHALPPLEAGIFSIDFSPLVKYPNGGIISIRLKADDNNYYELSNTDGYGPEGVSKYVGGSKVDGDDLGSGYAQGNDYTVTIYFSPTATTVEAFGQVLVMDTDTTVLTVSRMEVELYQQDAYLDNIRFSDDPFISITDPQSFDLQSSIDLQVRAATGNLQSGWGVQFTLENTATSEIQTIADYTAPFAHTFEGLDKSEYTLDAIVVDGETPPAPILGEYTSDMKESVGIGDYYAAFGDSITFGVGDEIVADDISLDLRNTGGGYPPILNDLLTASKGYPHTVVNAGVGGEDSSEGLARVQNVIDAHPEAIYFLILFGTNDSDGTMPVPSGLVDDFLDPGDPGFGELFEPGDSGYDGSFLDNMQQIVDVLVANGKTPFLAKVPIALGPCSICTPFADPEAATRNRFIRNYNTVIAALISDNGLGVAPDFYDYFSTNQDQFSDNLHFTGVGYQSMATLWFDALTAP